MSRKDFVLIAKALNDSKPADFASAPHQIQWEVTMKTVLQALKTNNLRFDVERFERACRGEACLSRSFFRGEA